MKGRRWCIGKKLEGSSIKFEVEIWIVPRKTTKDLPSQLFADSIYSAAISKMLATVKLHEFKGCVETIRSITPLAARHRITIKLFMATVSAWRHSWKHLFDRGSENHRPDFRCLKSQIRTYVEFEVEKQNVDRYIYDSIYAPRNRIWVKRNVE